MLSHCGPTNNVRAFYNYNKIDLTCHYYNTPKPNSRLIYLDIITIIYPIFQVWIFLYYVFLYLN